MGIVHGAGFVVGGALDSISKAANRKKLKSHLGKDPSKVVDTFKRKRYLTCTTGYYHHNKNFDHEMMFLPTIWRKPVSEMRVMLVTSLDGNFELYRYVSGRKQVKEILFYRKEMERIIEMEFPKRTFLPKHMKDAFVPMIVLNGSKFALIFSRERGDHNISIRFVIVDLGPGKEKRIHRRVSIGGENVSKIFELEKVPIVGMLRIGNNEEFESVFVNVETGEVIVIPLNKNSQVYYNGHFRLFNVSSDQVGILMMERVDWFETGIIDINTRNYTKCDEFEVKGDLVLIEMDELRGKRKIILQFQDKFHVMDRDSCKIEHSNLTIFPNKKTYPRIRVVDDGRFVARYWKSLMLMNTNGDVLFEWETEDDSSPCVYSSYMFVESYDSPSPNISGNEVKITVFNLRNPKLKPIEHRLKGRGYISVSRLNETQCIIVLKRDVYLLDGCGERIIPILRLPNTEYGSGLRIECFARFSKEVIIMKETIEFEKTKRHRNHFLKISALREYKVYLMMCWSISNWRLPMELLRFEVMKYLSHSITLGRFKMWNNVLNKEVTFL